MAGEIKNLEIFGAGTHRADGGSVTVTEGDLDGIVEAFSALQGSNIVKPHLKLGHADAQKWFGQDRGVPTLGWITRVWRQGSKLFADIANVPEALMNMIKAGRYHNVSAEVFWDAPIEVGGKTFSRVLSAVALLGTEMPAVKDLAGLSQALFASQFTAAIAATPTTFSSERPGMFTQQQVDSLVAAAVQTAVTKAVADETTKFSAEITDLKTQVTVQTKRADGAEAVLAKFQSDTAQADAVRIVDDAIKAGKMLPKQKDFALAFMSQKGVIKFGDGEKSPAKLFQEFLDASGTQVDLTERGASSGKSGGQNFATPAAEVDTKTKAEMAKDTTGKTSYQTAMERVLASDPQLKQRYVYGEVKAA